MRGTDMMIAACAFLTACVPAKGPETPRIYDNLEATHRVDIGTEGHGSGVVIDAEKGLLLTNAHVVIDEAGNKRDLSVNIAVGDAAPVTYHARAIAVDAKRDLALIKVDRRFERAVVLGELSDVHPGDAIYNVGFPYDLGELASKGTVRTVDYDNPEYGIENVILAEISDGPGTSGSGVFLERDGKLIGLMRGLIPRGPVDPKTGEMIIDGRLVVVRVVIRIDEIRDFLDDANVKYLTSRPRDGKVWNVAAGAPALEKVEIAILPAVQ
ncbi:MAG TPA: serine protease [Candidatus Baltobacteraceae bacterium]|nr:serine protease [Candidatus Baltobacteraceae bacterium]